MMAAALAVAVMNVADLYESGGHGFGSLAQWAGHCAGRQAGRGGSRLDQRSDRVDLARGQLEIEDR
jgi:hypothetical protein